MRSAEGGSSAISPQLVLALAALFLQHLLATCVSAQALPAGPAPQQSVQDPYTLRATSNIVLIPTQVQTRKGDILYALRPDQFVVEDNGIPQTIHLDEDTDTIGLSLVVAVQCSRSAAIEFTKLQGLAAMIDDLAGGAPREVEILSFGTDPVLLNHFTGDPAAIAHALSTLQPCDDDPGAAALDAVSYATRLLDARKNRYRHAILLVSEIRDHGSLAKPAEVIAALGRTNTVLDAVSFSPGRNEVSASLFHGQFGPGAIGMLIMAVEALRKNVPHTLAALSGGEYLTFTAQKSFDAALHQLSNHIHNYYLLSYQPPADPPPGLHRITVHIPDYPDARIRSRESWYAGQTPPPLVPPSAASP